MNPADGKPDALAVWTAWRAYHKGAGESPPKAEAKLIGTALKLLPVERLVRLVQWAHDAPHRAASFLRGPTYETARATGGKGLTGDYLGVANLMVQAKLLQRDGWAGEWEAAGRPVFTDAGPAKASEPDRVAALVTMLEELADHGGDPERCADPAKSRKVLAVWYGHGGGPASVAALTMRDRSFALRDLATAMVRARAAHEAARSDGARG